MTSPKHEGFSAVSLFTALQLGFMAGIGFAIWSRPARLLAIKPSAPATTEWTAWQRAIDVCHKQPYAARVETTSECALAIQAATVACFEARVCGPDSSPSSERYYRHDDCYSTCFELSYGLACTYGIHDSLPYREGSR